VSGGGGTSFFGRWSKGVWLTGSEGENSGSDGQVPRLLGLAGERPAEDRLDGRVQVVFVHGEVEGGVGCQGGGR